MNRLSYFHLFFISASFLILHPCSAQVDIAPPCFHDIGIKTAKTRVINELGDTLPDFQTIEYDSIGRPLRRIQDQPELIELVYIAKNLKQTIIHTRDPYTEEAVIDTNYVLKNDDNGRPMQIKGDNQYLLEISYEGCKKEFQTLTNDKGEVIFNLEIIKNNSIPILESFKYTNNEEFNSLTLYTDYKYNEQGHWIERKYERVETIVTEQRTLTYYK